MDRTLTVEQRAMLLSAKKERDYCTRGNKRTMRALVDKKLAEYSEGFGWKFGGIIALTEAGKSLAHSLITGGKEDV